MPADRLSPAECAQLGSLASAVDCRKVRVYRHNRGLSGIVRSAVLRVSGDRAVALGNHVFLPDRSLRDLPVLAHELTHCGQYQAWGSWVYFRRGAFTQLRDLLQRTLSFGSSPYRYEPEPAKPFAAYGMEQQGQIVEDCFRGHRAAQEISPFYPGQRSDQADPSA